MHKMQGQLYVRGSHVHFILRCGVQGVTYATQKLGALPNVAIYLDMAHSGWLGW